MGKIIRLDTKKLIPTQSELCTGKFGRLLEGYLRNPRDLLVFVRPSKFEKGKYLIGDGHNSSCMIDVLNEIGDFGLYGWVPKNDSDLIPNELVNYFFNNSFQNHNDSINYRFEELELGTYCGPSSIEELKLKYSWLKSPDAMFQEFAERLELERKI